LGKIFWTESATVEGFTVTFIHRGAPEDTKTIIFSSIVKVGRSWFTYRSNGGETLIPFHRILEVKNIRTCTSLWKKSR
jgi:uncharacterized protein (UPF0248 family)